MSQYPRTGVSALLVQDGKVLLIKRGREPAKDKWALPGGRQELGETQQQAVIREVKEETNLVISNPKLATLYEPIIRDKENRVIAHFVLSVFTSDDIKGNAKAGDDAAEFIWASRADLESLDMTSGSKGLIDSLVNIT